MIKSEFTNTLVEKFPTMSENEVSECVNLVLKYIGQYLSERKRIEVRGFGCFEVIHRPPRLAHNPKSLSKVKVKEKHRIHFKPGKELRLRVNASRSDTPIIDGGLDED